MDADLTKEILEQRYPGPTVCRKQEDNCVEFHVSLSGLDLQFRYRADDDQWSVAVVKASGSTITGADTLHKVCHEADCIVADTAVRLFNEVVRDD